MMITVKECCKGQMRLHVGREGRRRFLCYTHYVIVAILSIKENNEAIYFDDFDNFDDF